MKLLLIFILGLFTCGFEGFSQQNRFVYLQTDNKQPFYVKIGSVVYSSSTSGYLIIPKLTDKTYDLSIGFPKNEFPEQQISLLVAGKDAGYVLKNFGEKGWGLFNLQSMAVVMGSGKSTAANPEKPGSKNGNEFSRVLADVVNSPDIAQAKQVEQKQVEKEKTVSPNKPVESEKPAPANTPVFSGIRKLQDNISDTGRQMIYVDAGDTIQVHFPAARKEMNSRAGKRRGQIEERKGRKKKDRQVSRTSPFLHKSLNRKLHLPIPVLPRFPEIAQSWHPTTIF